MATIASIVLAGKGKAGSERSWTVESKTEGIFELRHYGTLMLEWREQDVYGRELLYAGTGHGSVSDQGGMNQAFRALKLPYRFDRDYRGGGPRITELIRA